MTRPGSLKYFGSPVLTAAGKVLAYPFMVFWMVGFIAGVIKIGRNTYYQFLLLIIVCFLLGSVAVVTSIMTDRFKIYVVPCIAMMAAYGWVRFHTGGSMKIIFFGSDNFAAVS